MSSPSGKTINGEEEPIIIKKDTNNAKFIECIILIDNSKIKEFKLDRCEFTGCTLNFKIHDMEFTNCKFSDCIFEDTSINNGNNFDGCEFEKSTLNFEEFNNSIFDTCKFQDFIMEFYSICEGLELINCSIKRVDNAEIIFREDVVDFVIDGSQVSNTIIEGGDLGLNIFDTNFNTCRFDIRSFKEECRIEKSKFNTCDFNNIHFFHCEMLQLIFVDVLLNTCEFGDCKLEKINLNGEKSIVKGSKFTSTSINDANFEDTFIKETLFEGCNMKQVELNRCRFDESIFDVCELDDVRFHSSIFSKTVFDNLILDKDKIIQFVYSELYSTFFISKDNMAGEIIVFDDDSYDVTNFITSGDEVNDKDNTESLVPPDRKKLSYEHIDEQPEINEPIRKYLGEDASYRDEPTDMIIDIFERGADGVFPPKYWRDSGDDIVKNADTLCRFNVSRNYIGRRVNDEDTRVIITLRYSKGGNEYLIGFVLADVDPNSCLYIDVICSNPSSQQIRLAGGKILINESEQVAHSMNLKNLTLSALLNVINYYRKLGFLFLGEMEREEAPEITRLSDANVNRIFATCDDTIKVMKIERALQLTRGPNKNGKTLENNMNILRVNLVRPDGDELQKKNYVDLTKEEAEQLLMELPEDVTKNNGVGGFYDLIYLLVKKGFVTNLGEYSDNKMDYPFGGGIPMRKILQKEQ